MWGAIHQWHKWSLFRALPYPGSLAEQPSRLLDALAVIEGEHNLYEARRHEIAMRRARIGGK